MRVRPKKMPLLQWLRRETARGDPRPGRGSGAGGKCACAGAAASQRSDWHEAEGVARGRRAHPCARQKQPIPSRWLSEKVGGERHGPALGAGEGA